MNILIIGCVFIVFGIFWIIYTVKRPLKGKDLMNQFFDYEDIFRGVLAIVIGIILLVIHFNEK